MKSKKFNIRKAPKPPKRDTIEFMVRGYIDIDIMDGLRISEIQKTFENLAGESYDWIVDGQYYQGMKLAIQDSGLDREQFVSECYIKGESDYEGGYYYGIYIRLLEGNESYECKMENYRKRKARYDKWYAANKENIEAELVRREEVKKEKKKAEEKKKLGALKAKAEKYAKMVKELENEYRAYD